MQSTKERLMEMERQSDYYGDSLEGQVNGMLDRLRPENLLAGLKNFFTKQLWRRNTLLIVGGGVLTFFVLRALLGSSSRRVIHTGDRERGLVLEEDHRPGFWSTLIRTSVQTFLLTYAKRLLTDYMERRRKPSTASSSRAQ